MTSFEANRIATGVSPLRWHYPIVYGSAPASGPASPIPPQTQLSSVLRATTASSGGTADVAAELFDQLVMHPLVVDWARTRDLGRQPVKESFQAGLRSVPR
jgi:hypothetical protein